MGKRYGLGGQGRAGCAVGIARQLDQVAGLRCIRNGAFAIGQQRFHLQQRAQWQVMHGHGGQCRYVNREESGIYGIHRGQVGDITQEDGDAHHIIHAVIDAFHDAADILEALFCLLTDTTGYQLAGGAVQRQLCRQIVVVGEGDTVGGLTVGGGKAGSVAGQNGIESAHGIYCLVRGKGGLTCACGLPVRG